MRSTYLVVFPEEVEVLLRRDDEGAAHGVRHHDEALQAHAHVVPAALVVPAIREGERQW
jgi:hypothetical protein